MIQALYKGIIEAIGAEYGSEYRKYKKPPEQGLKEPCFLVRCITPVSVPKIRNRATKSYTFHISYFPKGVDNLELECLEVGETLSDALQTVFVDGVAVHAKGELSSSVNDGVLQFTVTYSVYAMREEKPEESMETLEQTVSAVE